MYTLDGNKDKKRDSHQRGHVTGTVLPLSYLHWIAMRQPLLVAISRLPFVIVVWSCSSKLVGRRHRYAISVAVTSV